MARVHFIWSGAEFSLGPFDNSDIWSLDKVSLLMYTTSLAVGVLSMCIFFSYYPKIKVDIVKITIEHRVLQILIQLAYNDKTNTVWVIGLIGLFYRGPQIKGIHALWGHEMTHT